jgi:N12 class adenine-specific DNA methylase
MPQWGISCCLGVIILIELYGNILWNEKTANSYKNIILANMEDMKIITSTLNAVGMNYCAYIYNDVAHIATNRRDYDNIQRLNLPYKSIQHPKKESSPSKGYVFGNVEYKNIADKEYRKYNRDFALKLAERLQENNIKYSGKINKGSVTITFDKKDADALKEIVGTLSSQQNIFERTGNIKITNADAITQNKQFLNVNMDDNTLSKVIEHLNNKIDYTALSADGITTFTCDDTQKLQLLIDEAKENIQPDKLVEFLTGLKYTKEQYDAFIPVARLYQNKIDDNNFTELALNVFDNTYKYSAQQIAELSDLFSDLYGNLSGLELMFTDISKIDNLKHKFDNKLAFDYLTTDRGYTAEQLSYISKMLDENVSEQVIELLDYTFSVDDMTKFFSAYKNNSYDDLINVIADVKNLKPIEVKNLIDTDTYYPIIPPKQKPVEAIKASLKKFEKAQENEENDLFTQYQNIINENPDSVVALQVGEFFEFWGKNAKITAIANDLVITQRTVNGVKIDITGIPKKNIEDVIPEIHKTNHNVLICTVDDNNNINIQHRSYRPTITCNFSESSLFSKGKTYSIAEFDNIMKKADEAKIAGRKSAIEHYGSQKNWYNSNTRDEFTQFLGYDKTSFTINLPDGKTLNERQDIGDGFGGVINFLKQTSYDNYKNTIKLLIGDVFKSDHSVIDALNAEKYIKINQAQKISHTNISNQYMRKTEIGYALMGDTEINGNTIINNLIRTFSNEQEIIAYFQDQTLTTSDYDIVDDFLPFEYITVENKEKYIISRSSNEEYPYNVQQFISTDEGQNFFYCGNGKFCKTLDVAQEYISQQTKSLNAEKAINEEHIIKDEEVQNIDIEETISESEIIEGQPEPEQLKLENFLNNDIDSNFKITDTTSITGAKAKFNNNINAIKVLQTLESDNRIATAEEKQILSLYSGWGGLANAFDPNKDNWSKEYAELKKLLTESEYESARASTLDAFYTDPVIIDSIYKALENLGFKGGNVLEPSMGVGNFFGRLPNNLQGNVNLYGVEKDSLSGRIATKLYPKANITVGGYEDTKFNDNSFDIAIGNIPFGDFSVNDKQYNSQNLKIHDYFFAKSLDKVREGGVVAFITSTGTLDKQNSKFRESLAEKADLLGAIRLPNNAFKTAGTKVSSDIIFLQKRTSPPDKLPDWVNISETENGLPVNKYFTDNPQMVLGNIVNSGQYGRDDNTTVEPFENTDLVTLLNSAIVNIKGSLNNSVSIEEPIKKPVENKDVVIPENIRPESYFVSNDTLYFYGNTSDEGLTVVSANSILNEKQKSDKAYKRAVAFVELRETVRDLLNAQQEFENDEKITTLQRKLNIQYDAFYKQYGLIHSNYNRSMFSRDSSYPLLASLEAKYDKNKLIQKSDVFTKRTIKPPTVIESVDTAIEALTVSIAIKGKVDFEYMSKLSGKPKETLIENLQGEIYPVPELSSDDNIVYQTASEYLSGDIYKKLNLAQQYAEKNPLFNQNCVALEKSIPEPLKAGDIDIKLGATWIDPSYYQQFIYELFETPKEHRVDCPPRYEWQRKGRRNIEVEYSPIANKWNITNKSADNSVTVTKTYGTNYINAYALMERALNLSEPKVYKDKLDEYGRVMYDDKGNALRVLDAEKTKICQRKIKLIKREFSNWIYKDPERRANLVDTYNRQFNCIKPREYDGSNMIFPEMTANIELQQHQKDAVAQAIYGGNTLFAHSVGAGKTFEMIATAMESKRLGFCNKSLFAVPNHLTEQFGDDFLKLYPNANILVARKTDFEKDNRQLFLSKIATGTYDAVIIGHTQLKNLPLSPARQARIYKEQINDIINGIEALKKSEGSNFQIKAMERSRKSIQKKLDNLSVKKNDNAVYFEELGIDKLFVDEAHEFKNLFCVTKLTNVSGISSRASQRASDLYMKCRYLDEITNNNGVVFATGTPVSNSITELHTMMRYLQYDFLESHNNMQNFDNWVSIFGVQKKDYELDPTGTKFKERTRIAEYTNMPELITMFKQCANVKTADVLELDVPECDMHIVNCEPTELQQSLVSELADRADDVNAGSVDPSVDNMLKITSDGRKVGLDPRLINPDFEDNPNTKLNVCVNNVFKIYQDTTPEKLTQIIFCDLGVPKAKSKNNAEKDTDNEKSIAEIDSLEESGVFCIYDDIKEKLVAQGIPANEIAFIHDAKNETQKAELFSKVREGEVRILLGSTAKMGTGTNVQNRLVALHDLDVPWRPSDLEQRKGRMVRQGNINEKVHLYRYVTKGTFDAYSYQLLEKKQRFIGQVMTSKTPARRCTDIDQEAFTYSEIKALCTGDARIKEKLTLENRVKELNTYKTEYNNTRYELEDKVSQYSGLRERICHRMSNIKKDIDKSASIPRDEEGKPIFKANIGGIEYTDREKAVQALADVVSSIKGESNRGTISENGTVITIGEIYGFPIEIKNVGYYADDIEATICGSERYRLELTQMPTLNLKKIEKGIFSFEVNYEKQQNRLNKLDVDFESAQKVLSQPFEFENELKEKSARLDKLTDKLNAEAVKRMNSGSKKERTNLFGKKLILETKNKLSKQNPKKKEKSIDNSKSVPTDVSL